MKPFLLVDFGSTYTKLTAVDLSTERILGTAKSFTTVDTDIHEGFMQALRELEEAASILKWENIYACSSAAGGLKMIAIGFVPELTSEAAKQASLSAGAKVLKTYSNILSKSEQEEIIALRPDIILLTGGTDGGNSQVILGNAEIIAKLPIEAPIIVAGNKCAGDEVKSILNAHGKEAILCENVMPRLNELNIESAKEAIRQVFLSRIIKAKGLTKIQSLMGEIIMPTPTAVLKAARLLAEGCEEEAGIGELMVIDIGGATTDIHSVCDKRSMEVNVIYKGLEEPKVKRTVEGDLGLRYSANTLVEGLGIGRLMKTCKLPKAAILSCLESIDKDKELVPKKDSDLMNLDFSLASLACEESIDRHCGRIEQVYTPFGAVYQITGKDLREVKWVIGTGGPIINSMEPGGILKVGIYSPAHPMILRPQKPRFLLDKSYILAAMGLLGEFYPVSALRIMKKVLIEVTDEV